MVRRVSSDTRAGEALRGSDSQLCPKPPPKPCKAPGLKAPPSPAVWPPSEANYCELNLALAAGCDGATRPPLCAQDSYVELLTAKQNGAPGPRTSDTSYLILDDDDGARPWGPPPARRDQGREDEGAFVRPLLETASSFKPNDFESQLLPPENKPLETALLKRAKELFASHDPRVIAQHMLSVDCKVGARGGCGRICKHLERASAWASVRLSLDMLFAHRKAQVITRAWGLFKGWELQAGQPLSRRDAGEVHVGQRVAAQVVPLLRPHPCCVLLSAAVQVSPRLNSIRTGKIESKGDKSVVSGVTEPWLPFFPDARSMYQFYSCMCRRYENSL